MKSIKRMNVGVGDGYMLIQGIDYVSTRYLLSKKIIPEFWVPSCQLSRVFYESAEMLVLKDRSSNGSSYRMNCLFYSNGKIKFVSTRW